MRDYLNMFLGMRDPAFLKKQTQAIMRRELPQTWPAMADAADYTCRLLRDEGFEAELIPFPADGRTLAYDNFMPIAWDASYGTLTVTSGWDGDPVIADYRKEPFSLIRYSCPTPEGGIDAKVVPFDRMLAGEDVKGAFVLVPDDMRATNPVLNPALDRGALGLINASGRGGDLAPDSVNWVNYSTETNCWYTYADERPFVSFSISANRMRQLRAACAKGEVTVHAETDGHRYEGTMYAVTGVLPGESEKEFWLFAHLTEPLEDDNSAGVAACIKILKDIRQGLADGRLPRLKYTIRVIFTAERYGFAAMGEHFGPVLRDRCIGALNVDGMPIVPETVTMKIMFAAPCIPFFGNAVVEDAFREASLLTGKQPFVVSWSDHYDDDCFMGDTSVGLPTIMPEYTGIPFWHNSRQRWDFVDYGLCARVTAVYCAAAAAIACADPVRLEAILPRAVTYARARLSELAADTCVRPGTDAKARLMYWAQVEANRVRDFTLGDADPEAAEAAAREILSFAEALTPAPAPARTADTPLFDAASHLIPEQLVRGLPHDLCRAPHEKRAQPFSSSDLGPMFSYMDGRRSMQELIVRAEWEQRHVFSEAQLAALADTYAILEKYGYIRVTRV